MRTAPGPLSVRTAPRPETLGNQAWPQRVAEPSWGSAVPSQPKRPLQSSFSFGGGGSSRVQPAQGWEAPRHTLGLAVDRQPSFSGAGGLAVKTLSKEPEAPRLAVASASGKAYEVVTDLRIGGLAYTDRDYAFTDLGSFLPTNGFGYVRVANGDKMIGSQAPMFTVTASAPVKLYLVFYRPNSQEHEVKRPWVQEEGWALDSSLDLPAWTMPGQQIEEVRVRACGPGSTVVHGSNAISGTPLVFYRFESPTRTWKPPPPTATMPPVEGQRTETDDVIPDGVLNMHTLGKKKFEEGEEDKTMTSDLQKAWLEVQGFLLDWFGAARWLDADGDGKIEFSDLKQRAFQAFDTDGDGKMELSDVLEGEVEGPSAQEASNRWPFFMVLQTILAAGWWFAGSFQAIEASVPWADRVGGLETVFPGRTSLRLSEDCADYRHEVWRWVTYQFTHVGIGHIMTNSLMNLLMGIPLERFHGWIKMAAMFNVGVLGGAACYMVADNHNVVVGMSGGCYSLLGIQLGDLIMNWKQRKYRKPKLALLVFVVGMDTLISMTNQPEGRVTPSHSAHFGGAVAGCIMAVLVGRNLVAETWEKWLQAAVLLLGVALLAFCLGFGLSWPSRTVFDTEPWCWTRQVSNATVFGDWDWRCVRCHSQECIDRWSSEARIYTVSMGICHDWGGWAYTEP